MTTMRYEVRIQNGGTYVDASYAGGVRGRETALTDAASYIAKYRSFPFPTCREQSAAGASRGCKVSVVEVRRTWEITAIAWTAMYDGSASDGPLVWVLERATGMASGECDSLGIDWRAEKDRRIALGGEW